MVKKYYSVRIPPTREFDINLISDSDLGNQNVIDEKFISKLSTIGLYRSRKKIYNFLSYHIRESNVSKKEFLDHTEDLFKKNENLMPFGYSIGYVKDWLSLARRQFNLPRPNDIEHKKPKREDPSFDEIIKDKGLLDRIIQRLKLKGFVSEDLTWNGISARSKKSELIALIQILVAWGVVRNEPKALLGRIFTKKFKCKMNPRHYTTPIKKDILDGLITELKGLVPNESKIH